MAQARQAKRAVSQELQSEEPLSLESQSLESPSNAPIPEGAAALMAAAGGGNAMVNGVLGGDGGGGGDGGPDGFKGDFGSFLARMERAFGASFGALEIVDGEAGERGLSAGAAATIQGDRVFVGEAFAQLPVDKQERAMAHEFAHREQKDAKEGVGGDAEADAEQAAAAALAGQPAEVQVSAAPGAAQDISFGEAWDAVATPVSNAVGGVVDAIADWGLEQIGDAADLLSYIAEVGEEQAKALLNLVITHKVEIAISFITMNPAHGLMVYVVRRLPADKIVAWLSSIDVKKAAVAIGLIAAAGAIAVVAGPLLGLGASCYPILKELTGPTIALLWAIAPDDMKAYAAQVLVDAWPEGLGVALDAQIGATFGYPVYVDAAAFFEVSHIPKGSFKVRRGGVLEGGLDTGVGAGGFFGFAGGKEGGGQGEGGVGVGAEVGAQARAGLQMTVLQEFNFPTTDDNGFGAFLISVTQSDTSTSMQVLSMLRPEFARVNPMSYNTMTKLELKVVGDANAGAFAGVRTAGANTQQGGSTWNNQEGARDNGAAKWWQRWMSASVFGRIAAEGGVGFEMRNKEFTQDAEGVRVPSEMEVDVYGEASAALAIVHAIPVISSSLPQVPSFDGGGGIKVTWTLTGGVEDTEPTLSEPTWQLYVKTGDMDRYNGAASETTIALSNLNEETFESLESFLGNIQAGTKFKRRFFLGTTLGRKYVRAAERQGGFNVLLPAEYRSYGFRIEGYVDLESQLSAAQIRAIFTAIAAIVDGYADGGEPLQQLYLDVMSFIATGQGPAHVTGQLRNIADAVLSGLTELKMHGLVGLSVAAGAKLSAGAKARLQGQLGGQLTMDQDLLQWAGGSVSVEDIEQLISGAVSGTGAVEVNDGEVS